MTGTVGAQSSEPEAAVPPSVLAAALASYGMRRSSTVLLNLAWERWRAPRPGADRDARMLCFTNDERQVYLDVHAVADRFDLFVSVDPPRPTRVELLHVPGKVSLVSEDPLPIPFLQVPDGWVSLLVTPSTSDGADIMLQTPWTRL